ncbi:hypothetical protein J7I43_17975 [Chitinophaga sp. MAH-28]|uniref:Uncharacterized protein n=1 Tax=Chitinophaga chungangae TaxID=2821488 RepID=A0ABS3YJ36_9BACT|nr:hypothetical protein [Chitinophaga chungangae]
MLGDGASAGTINEAAKAEIVLLSLPWSQAPALKDVTDWNSKTVIDATKAERRIKAVMS